MYHLTVVKIERNFAYCPHYFRGNVLPVAVLLLFLQLLTLILTDVLAVSLKRQRYAY